MLKTWLYTTESHLNMKVKNLIIKSVNHVLKYHLQQTSIRQAPSYKLKVNTFIRQPYNVRYPPKSKHIPDGKSLHSAHFKAWSSILPTFESWSLHLSYGQGEKMTSSFALNSIFCYQKLTTIQVTTIRNKTTSLLLELYVQNHKLERIELY